MRLLMMTTWAVLAVLIVAGIHYYLWARLVRDTGIPGPWNRSLAVALVGLAVSMPLGMIAYRTVRSEVAAPLVWFVFLWMGLMFLLLFAVGSVDVVRLVVQTVATLSGASIDPSRRLFFSRIAGGVAAFSALGLAAVAVHAGTLGPPVRNVTVRLRRLSHAMHGTRVVQISDLHVGPTIGHELVADLVARTNALRPDIVVITGDLVDAPVPALREVVAPIGDLQARFGTFFVTGNHEYYIGAAPWVAELERIGIRTLQNERVRIGDDDTGFDLAGVNDPTAVHFGDSSDINSSSSVAHACRGCDPERELLLLAHQPKAIWEAAKHGVGLQLSGHTHGGQIWPFGYIVRLTQPYLAGLAQHDERTQIYVSRGAGHWGPPMRLGAPSELSCIELLCDPPPPS